MKCFLQVMGQEMVRVSYFKLRLLFREVLTFNLGSQSVKARINKFPADSNKNLLKRKTFVTPLRRVFEKESPPDSVSLIKYNSYYLHINILHFE